MIRPSRAGMPARITFTMDYHELLTGDLRPGEALSLSYDPLRIATTDEPVVHGDPARPVMAHARFRVGGHVQSVRLATNGMTTTVTEDPTGHRGLMYSGDILVPADAHFVSIWFTCQSRGGQQLTDDAGGSTYCFRFPSQDILIRTATVIQKPGTDLASFAVELESIQPVQRVSVRYHVQNKPEAPTGDIELQRSGTDEETQRQIWSGSEMVPVDSLIKFKVHYWLGDVRYKEDNSSSYFMAPQRPVPEALAMPDALAEAARKWVW